MNNKWHITNKLELKPCSAKDESKCPYYTNSSEFMAGYPTHFDDKEKGILTLNEVLEEKYLSEIENKEPKIMDDDDFSEDQYNQDMDDILKNIDYYNSSSHLPRGDDDYSSYW